jgi:uncharacterized membrane protein
MIQRVQSLYLFLAALAAVLMFAFPLAKFYGNSNFAFYLYQIQFFDPAPTMQLSPYFLLPLMALVVFVVILSLAALFSFKNRNRQMNITKIAMALVLILLGAYFFGYIGILESNAGNPAEYGLASFMPAISFLFLLLASRGIQKDENLIKSMDRLR